MCAKPDLSLPLLLLLLAVQLPATGQEANRPQHVAELSTLTPREKQQLLRNRDRFKQLPAGERQRLRELHTAIQSDPDANRLQQVLRDYHDWLQTLSTGQRIELLELPPDQRIQRIRSIRRREGRQRFNELALRALSESDREAISAWLQQLLRDREQVRDLLPPELRRRLQRMEPSARRRTIQQALRRRIASDREFIDRLTISDAEVETLSRSLTAAARRNLAAARDPQALLRRWIVALLFSANLPEIDAEELRRFRQTLDGASRDYLENLPRQRMRSELQRMYIRQRIQGLGRGRR